MKSISIVVPVFNEEAVVSRFTERLFDVLEGLTSRFQFEVIFVNDGSRDATQRILEELVEAYPGLKIIAFSRNFGHQSALLAGLRHANGDAVITMDGDLQHPPEMIVQLIAAWEDGAQIVSTRRIDGAGLHWRKRLTSRGFYRIFRRLSGLSIEAGMADYRLVDRVVLNALRDIDERTLFLRGMLQWIGYRQVTLPYQAGQRAAGESKFTLGRMISLAINGITAFSVKPLRVAMLLGFVFSGLSFVYLGFVVVTAWTTDWNVPGWTSVIGSVLFLGGVQLICLGIIGEYIGKIYLEVKHRPHFVIAKRVGFDDR